MHYQELRRTFRSKVSAVADRSGDHIYYYLFVEGKEHQVGKISHSARGSDKVEDHVINDNARRLKLSRKELFQLVDCPLTGDDHKRLWQERPRLH